MRSVQDSERWCFDGVRRGCSNAAKKQSQQEAGSKSQVFYLGNFNNCLSFENRGNHVVLKVIVCSQRLGRADKKKKEEEEK